MEDFFSSNSPAMRFLTALGNLILVNFVFIISSLPIVTIGASLTALYRVCHEIRLGNSPSVFKDYFKEFVSSFKNSTIVWIVTLLLAAFFVYDLYVINYVIDPMYQVLQIPVFVFLFLISCVWIYAFPMFATLDQDLKTTVKNSLLLGFAKLPTTILVLFVYAVMFLLADWNQAFVVYFFSVSLLMGFSTLNWFFGLFIDRILKIDKKSLKERELAKENASPDISDSDDDDEENEDNNDSDADSDS